MDEKLVSGCNQGPRDITWNLASIYVYCCLASKHCIVHTYCISNKSYLHIWLALGYGHLSRLLRYPNSCTAVFASIGMLRRLRRVPLKKEPKEHKELKKSKVEVISTYNWPPVRIPIRTVEGEFSGPFYDDINVETKYSQRAQNCSNFSRINQHYLSPLPHLTTGTPNRHLEKSNWKLLHSPRRSSQTTNLTIWTRVRSEWDPRFRSA